ncbi:BolA/IbaG family iron-sulfur metabolism protein [Ehrlichia ruminantium]|uniref:BolA family transcriptional regulator n=1 Tax=Ehrlichia ruminantium (strain Welgevonden) TaxID=254945 RepID=A0A0H3M6K0_EHRRW|nr:BolA/IbaG family iron-sulfur metabolism protein [Ehrlichia ruminantium]KYW90397.1 cell division protein BolA [Ehrlichia ruminantium]QLK50775.1 BolA/IbaG family iron-sulfur metabolism protein [Ehrlichia ruminantium]QLK51697.1 BolA/IbaG family iron-sulfur metabolism protein [Ehrlichia ruminantium]QLK53535.1 BolA/IbaG family iron-sulfur metabolism protein [Ehrlichia ruminantium]QLK55373.1 BolA/IbaG family iron-sulfur metabolism protein [Ehrlichia ruminantium]
MSVTQLQLEQVIKNAFPEADITVTSLVDDNNHYSIKVVSHQFHGKSKLEQHRMVYKVLDGLNIHAIQIKTESK